MRRWIATCALLLATHTARADDLVLRDMGSFHVSGRLVEITGRPERDVQVVDLPDGGMSGNSHMMMDRNNFQLSQVVQDWLVGKGLAEQGRRGHAQAPPTGGQG